MRVLARSCRDLARRDAMGKRSRDPGRRRGKSIIRINGERPAENVRIIDISVNGPIFSGNCTIKAPRYNVVRRFIANLFLHERKNRRNKYRFNGNIFFRINNKLSNEIMNVEASFS